MKKTVLFLLISWLTLSGILAQTYNVLEYGAVADGKTNCTKAIQKVIDRFDYLLPAHGF